MKKPSPVNPTSLLLAQRLSRPNAPPHTRIVQPKIAVAPPKPRQPVAPPAYRPQPVPKVLQTKMATSSQPFNQTRRAPVAPPVYKPQPAAKCLQAKTAGSRQPQASQPPSQPVAPPVYRPQPTPRVLQKKDSQTKVTAPARHNSPPPPRGRQQATIQRLKKDAVAVIRANGLHINADYLGIQAYVQDISNPSGVRDALRDAWNLNQNPNWIIESAPRDFAQFGERQQELMKAALLTMMDVMQNEVIMDEVVQDEDEGANMGIKFDPDGWVLDPEEGRKASKTNRLKIYKNTLGLAEHVLRGHFFDDATLISQAKSNKNNFTWTSDKALINAISKAGGKNALAVDIPDGAGYGIITADDDNMYRVYPKKARIIFMSKGDFKTGYGVAEVKTVARFGEVYHRVEQVG